MASSKFFPEIKEIPLVTIQSEFKDILSKLFTDNKKIEYYLNYAANKGGEAKDYAYTLRCITTFDIAYKNMEKALELAKQVSKDDATQGAITLEELAHINSLNSSSLKQAVAQYIHKLVQEEITRHQEKMQWRLQELYMYSDGVSNEPISKDTHDNKYGRPFEVNKILTNEKGKIKITFSYCISGTFCITFECMPLIPTSLMNLLMDFYQTTPQHKPPYKSRSSIVFFSHRGEKNLDRFFSIIENYLFCHSEHMLEKDKMALYFDELRDHAILPRKDKVPSLQTLCANLFLHNALQPKEAVDLPKRLKMQP